MVNILRKLGKPGDPISILGFDNTAQTVEISKGWVQQSDYLSQPMTGSGIEKNIAKPLILKENGKAKGLIYPAALHIGEGAGFKELSQVDLGGVKFEDKEVTDTEGTISHIERTIEYPGIPFTPQKTGFLSRFRNKTAPVYIRFIRYKVSPIIQQIQVSPLHIGATCDSQIVRDTIMLKPQRWQMAVCLIAGWAIGAFILHF